MQSLYNIFASIWAQIHIYIDENQTPCKNMVFGVVSNDGFIKFFFKLVHLKHKGQHKVLRVSSVLLNREYGFWKTLHLAKGLYAMIHKQNNPVMIDWLQIFCKHILTNIWMPKSPTIGKNNDSISFSNLKETVGKAC